MKKTISILKTPGGIPFIVPNEIVGEGDGFYISYNNVDTSDYGSDTTALVIGQMEHFYILNGNHTANYLPLIKKGLNHCLKYFNKNKKLINKFSEKQVIK